MRKKRTIALTLAITIVLSFLFVVPAFAMQIYVETPEGKILSFDVEPTDVIDSLFAKIQEKEGVPPDRQRLYFGELLLEGGKTLSDYNIQKDSVLRLELECTHDYDDEWHCDENGHWQFCTLCNDTTAHDHHSTNHWATCTTPQLCIVCDAVMTAAMGHYYYGDTWLTDDDEHWRECYTCGEKSGIAAHIPGGWIVGPAATATADGSQHKECTVCGHITSTEVIPAMGPAITAPVITGNKNVTLAYRGEKYLGTLVTGEELVWSSSSKYVRVDSGKITSPKFFRKTGTATIKAENSAGFVEFNVKVQPTIQQWLMIVFLLGWIWY